MSQTDHVPTRSPVGLVHAGLDGAVNAGLALLHALDGGVQVCTSLVVGLVSVL